MMLQVLSILTLMFNTAWAQDQARSQGSLNPQFSVPAPKPTCKRGKDYLERDLLAMANLDLSKPDPLNRNPINSFLLQIKQKGYRFIDRGCVEDALATVTAGGFIPGNAFRTNRFMRCTNDKKVVDNQDEPCQMEEYTTLVHNSFELTTQCLKGFVAESNDPQDQNDWVEGFFKMLTVESGLNVNAVSQIGAMGAGQIMAVYIQEFREKTLADLREYLQKSSPGCRRLLPVISDERIDKLLTVTSSRYDSQAKRHVKTYGINRCSNIDINDGQPLINLIISFSNLRQYKRIAFGSLFQNKRYANMFRGIQSGHKLADLEMKLTALSYNLGPDRLKDRVEWVLKNNYGSSAPVTSVDHFIEQVGGVRGKNYVNRVEARYKQVLNGRPSCRSDRLKTP